MKLRKVLAVLLSVAMLAGCLGMTVTATETDDLAGRIPYAPEKADSLYTEETKTFEYNVTRVHEENGERRVEETVETETVTRYVPVDQNKQPTLNSVGQPHENVFTFTTFEDLKMLTLVEYTSYAELVYEGNGPLVISEDLTMPAYVSLYFADENAHMIINEGVTFETSQYSNGIQVKKLEVKGTLIAKNYMYVEELLNVSGELIMWSDIELKYGAQIIGAENIKQKYDYCHLNWHVEIQTLEQLEILANEAAASVADYSVVWCPVNDVVLTRDLVLPANLFLQVIDAEEVTFTVAAGATLEIHNDAYIDAPMVVAGTLKLYGSFSCGYTLTFTSTGSLAGRGYLNVFGMVPEGMTASYTDVVTGLDPAKIYVEETTRFWDEQEGVTYNEYQWKIYSSEGKTKLSTPTELQWNKATDWGWNDETGESYTYPVDSPASSLWKCGEITQNEYRVTFYRKNADGSSEEMGRHWYYGGSMDQNEYYSVDGFERLDNLETGDYYFTVQAIADGENYINSDIATSGVWHYVKPTATMGTCSDLQWNFPKANWISAPATDAEPYYEVQVLYSPVSFEEPWRIASSRTYEENYELWDDVLESHGVGFYYFRVRLVSEDITKVFHGDWSNLSPVFKVTHVSDEVSVDLDSILGNTDSMTEEEIRQSVQDLDTEELKKSMVADQGASGVIDALVELEAAVGGPAAVQVNEDAADFDASKVSVVGANLNDAAVAEEPITLVIDKPEREHVVDTMYDNAVAVSFSMTLDNVEDAENLEVPVMITIPIPASINPNFLVVLHYAQDGSVQERILPHIFREGPQWYASFALTSFSDFVMTQVDVNRPTVDMFRMYDPNSGEHFYTGSIEERENLVAAGWNYEGVGFTFPLTTGDPVHRLYDPVTGEHLYTMDVNEKAQLEAAGWNYEGIAFNSGYDIEVPQYRLHNPNATRGAYHFTASQKEADYLVSIGWEYQGIGWYSCGVIPE